MATSLTIVTGNLTSALSTQNDTAAQNVLLNFASAIGVPEAASAQVKLDAITAYLVDYMQQAAREKYFQTESANLRQQAIDNVHF